MNNNVPNQLYHDESPSLSTNTHNNPYPNYSNHSTIVFMLTIFVSLLKDLSPKLLSKYTHTYQESLGNLSNHLS
jgi:hypothetical protein